MTKLSKKFVFTIFIVLIAAIAGFGLYETAAGPTANVYIENNTVTCDITPFYTSYSGLEEDICKYVLDQLNNYSSDADSVKDGIKELGREYGIDGLNVKLDSEIGEDRLCSVFDVSGTSMVPTLQDGQSVLVEKTKDIHTGDIVIAKSPEYGIIVKRASEIDGDEIYLTSDNKKISYEEIDGAIYKVKGITTWVDISDIYGVVVSY